VRCRRSRPASSSSSVAARGQAPLRLWSISP